MELVDDSITIARALDIAFKLRGSYPAPERTIAKDDYSKCHHISLADALKNLGSGPSPDSDFAEGGMVYATIEGRTGYWEEDRFEQLKKEYTVKVLKDPFSINVS